MECIHILIFIKDESFPQTKESDETQSYSLKDEMLSFLAKTATKAAEARSVLMLDLASASMPCISLYT